MTGFIAPTARTAGLLAAAALLALVVPLPLVAAIVAALAVVAAVDAGRAILDRPVGPRPPVPSTMVRNRPVSLEPMEVPGAVVHQPDAPAFGVEGWTLTPLARGRHAVPPPRAVVDGPLGLARWIGAVGDPRVVTVLPDRFVPRRAARTAVAMTRYDDEGGRVLGPLGLGTAFEALRMYQPDDDVRLVNWRATQRFGEPIVNQYRLELSREVLVAIDCGRTARGTRPDGTDRLDTLVDAAATVALTADIVGDRCGLVAFADGPMVELAPRASGGAEVVRRLATVQASGAAGDPRAALSSIGRKRMVVVLLTDLLDAAGAALLLDAVPVATRRHRIVIVSPIDPDLAGAIEAGPSSPRAALRAAAAAELLEDAASVAHQLRRAGASVTLAPAASLPAAATSAYLTAGNRRPAAMTATT